MINKIKNLFTRARKGGSRLVCGLGLGLGLAAALPEHCSADTTGPFVVPRPIVLFSQLVTNGGPAYLFSLTNMLNYSGFHRLGLWVSLSSTNPTAPNGAQSSTNWAVSLYPTIGQPGGLGGYSNSILGTNWATANAPWFTESFLTGPNLAGVTNQLWATNLDWQVADAVQVLNGKLTLTGSNAVPYYVEVDGVLVP